MAQIELESASVKVRVHDDNATARELEALAKRLWNLVSKEPPPKLTGGSSIHTERRGEGMYGFGRRMSQVRPVSELEQPRERGWE